MCDFRFQTLIEKSSIRYHLVALDGINEAARDEQIVTVCVDRSVVLAFIEIK